ncbi:hypothetical protein L3Q82_003371 [Scortum barcoo]|uniref:Uncharacterized protein n=1 Tax=Scortum barcoo TaxID=214431 RepID=A0ACB8VMD0_9TELE|nr:hypothetical protein L3Q82_003371 [Scortum barcoo]
MSWTLSRVKRGAELSTDHHLVVSWTPLAEEEVGQTWQTKQTYCEGLLGTSGRALCVREVFTHSHLRKSFSQILRGRLGTLSPRGLCSAPLPPLSIGCGSTQVGTGRPSKPQPGRSWRQKLGLWEGLGGVR